MIDDLKITLTVIARVSSADSRRVNSCLPLHCQGVVTESGSCLSGETREGLEVQPQLADIVRGLVEGVGAGGGTGGCVAAGVSRVPDVGGVGGDGGATSCAGNHTAHSKPRGTVSVSSAALRRTLRAGVAGPKGGGGTRPCTLLVGELDDGEEGECL